MQASKQYFTSNFDCSAPLGAVTTYVERLWIIGSLEVGISYTSVHTVVSSCHREVTSGWD